MEIEFTLTLQYYFIQRAKGFIYKMTVAKVSKKKWLQGKVKLDREEIKL